MARLTPNRWRPSSALPWRSSSATQASSFPGVRDRYPARTWTTYAPVIASGSAWADPRRQRYAASSPGTDRENPPSFLPPESSIIIKTHFLTHPCEAMAKKAKAKVKAAATQPSPITTRKKTDKVLRQAVRAIPGFPDLKVHQWMPTLMS